MIFASVLDDQVYPLPILSLLGIILITSLKTLPKLLKRNYQSTNQQEPIIRNGFTDNISEVITDTRDEDNSIKEINKPERIENKLQIASVSSVEQELSEEGFILEDERIESAEECELDGIEEDYEEDTLVQDEQDNLSIITAIEVELDLTNNLSGLIDPQVGEPCFAEKLPKIRKARRLRRRIASFIRRLRNLNCFKAQRLD